MLGFLATQEIAVAAYGFPMPFWHLLSSAVGIGAGVLGFLSTFPIETLRDQPLFRRSLLWRMVAFGLGPGFVAVYCVYFGVFSRLKGTGAAQVWCAIAWTPIKLGVKKIGEFTLTKGHNTDTAPYLLGILDAAYALAANFLFTATDDIAVVIALVSMDLAENSWMTLTALEELRLAKQHEVDKKQRDTERRQRDTDERQRDTERRLRLLEGMLYRNNVDKIPMKSIITQQGDGNDTSTNTRDDQANSEHSDRQDIESARPILVASDDVAAAAHKHVLSIRKKRGLQVLINLYVSEYSEIIVSCSSALVCLGMYFSPNKEHTYLTRGAKQEDLLRTLRFLGLDIVCEYVLFVCLCFFVKLSQNIDVIATGRTYFSFMKLRRSAFFALIYLCYLNVVFTFDKHAGLYRVFQ